MVKIIRLVFFSSLCVFFAVGCIPRQNVRVPGLSREMVVGCRLPQMPKRALELLHLRCRRFALWRLQKDLDPFPVVWTDTESKRYQRAYLAAYLVCVRRTVPAAVCVPGEGHK